MPTHVLAPGAPGGPLVVCAHGLEDGWATWEVVAGELDPSWRLVALDLPWRTDTDYGWRVRPPRAWLRDALDELGERPDVLVAHSFGGTAALDLAAAGGAPAGAALGLLCPVYRAPGGRVTWPGFDATRDSFLSTLRDGVRAHMEARALDGDAELVRLMTELAEQRVGPVAFVTVFDEMLRSARIPVHRVRGPLGVLTGGTDATLTPASAEALAGAAAEGELRLDDRLDHHCHVRRPEVVAEWLDALMARALRTAGPGRAAA